MRVVVDSGVWVSAFQYLGAPLDAIDRVLAVDRLCICRDIELEVTAVLARKFDWLPEATRAALAVYLQGAEIVPITGAVAGACRDPKDDMVLECALAGRADLLITGDRDLLSLGIFQNTRILTPRAYLQQSLRA